MGRKSNATSGMNVEEKQATPLARRLNELIVDGNALKDYLGVSAQAINQYRLGMARPSLENLCKIAKFYDVSTDYLLGLTDTPSIKTDIRTACKTTGLSAGAVEALQTMGDIFVKDGLVQRPVFRQALSSILENRGFSVAVIHTVQAADFRNQPEIDNDLTARDISDAIGKVQSAGLVVLSQDMAREYHLQRAAEEFVKIIRDIQIEKNVF